MPKWSKDIEQMPAPEPGKPKFPRLLTLAQVREILNWACQPCMPWFHLGSCAPCS